MSKSLHRIQVYASMVYCSCGWECERPLFEFFGWRTNRAIRGHLAGMDRWVA